MPSAPRPTQAKNAISAMLWRVRVSSGSSGLPKSLRRSVASAMSAAVLPLEPFFDPPAEDRHFLRGLLVPLALGHRDALAVRRDRVREPSRFGERAAEELPRRRIPGVAFDRFAQVDDGAAGIARFQ